jgi:hypothetical protein
LLRRETAPHSSAQGIEAEIPEALGTKAEELERKARSRRVTAGMRPDIEKIAFFCYKIPVTFTVFFLFMK